MKFDSDIKYTLYIALIVGSTLGAMVLWAHYGGDISNHITFLCNRKAPITSSSM